MEKVVAGLDIGTSSIKLVLYGEGEVIYSERMSHSKQDSEGREIDPVILLKDVIYLLRKAIKTNKNVKICAIGLSSLFPSIMAVDEKGKPLTKIITWLDIRGNEIAKDYKKQHQAAILLQKKTGCVIHGSHSIWKILWLKKNKKNLFKRVKKYLSLSDYLVYKLTGKYLVSYAIASTTGLFNISSLKWDKEILKMIGISERQLPECRSIYHSEKFLKEMKLRIGCDAETLLVLGAGDGQLSNVGSGCLDIKTMCSTVGTSSALRIIGDYQNLNNSIWKCYLCDKMYVYGIAINAGLRTLAWFHKNIFHRNLSSLSSDIDKINLNRSTNLIFLPFIDGERGPHYRQEMTASLSGLSSTNTSNDVYKAIIEGVLFNLYQCYGVMVEHNNKPKEIIATGGYVYSRKILQMQSDIFNCKIKVPAFKENSAVGAAIVALAAIEEVSSLSNIKIKHEKVYIPNKKRHREHMRKYGQYNKKASLIEEQTK
ncbi:gluconokinase [Candidatus Margulisiibacteriota bacterium]